MNDCKWIFWWIKVSSSYKVYPLILDDILYFSTIEKDFSQRIYRAGERHGWFEWLLDNISRAHWRVPFSIYDGRRLLSCVFFVICLSNSSSSSSGSPDVKIWDIRAFNAHWKELKRQEAFSPIMLTHREWWNWCMMLGITCHN